MKVRFAPKMVLTPNNLREIIRIASNEPRDGWNYDYNQKKQINIQNYEYLAMDGNVYYYRVNIGHNLITFLKIEND